MHENAVTDDRAKQQFELAVGGETAVLAYERTPSTLTLIHTEVPIALRGHHLGETLVKAALDAARTDGLRVVVVCPFAKVFLRKHSDLQRSLKVR